MEIEDSIKDIINDIRKVKRKKPDKEFIVREATENYGLAGDSVETALESLLKESKIYIKDGDSFFVTEDSRQQKDGKTGKKRKAPKTVETVDCECQTDPVDSCEDDRLKNNTGMAALNQQKLYEVLGQLSLGVTELNRILHEERTKSQTLLEENFKLKYELRAKEENTDTLSTSNKEIQDHKDTTESVIVQTEKDIVSPQKSAKRKNKRRRGRSVVNKSTTNAEENINIQSNPESSTTEPSSSQTSSAAKDPTVVEPSEANQSPESSSKQSPNKTNRINNGAWPKNTVLIAGDSMLSNIDETKLSHRYHTKVRAFKGSSIEDLHDYLKPLLKKRPDKIILLIGTNDLQNKSVADILKGLKSLLDMIQSSIPNCKVVVSEIIRREDRKSLNGKLSEFNRALKTMNVDILRQQNITSQHLGRKGLHLNFEGNIQLAKNIIDKLRSFSF